VSPPGFAATLDTTIEFSPRAPADARRAVERLGSEIGLRVLRDVQLLVSEVVTNSIRHSGSDDPIALRVWLRSNGVKVEVADSGCGFEAAEFRAHDDAEGGRGLMIVDALADRWGVSNDAQACVWFELKRAA
jgi:anti-sigma regulatory factor (Ser/Thr protein kinase)